MKLDSGKAFLIGLIAVLTIVLILELRVTLKSQIVFGDEGFHARWAQWIGENREYPVWNPFENTNLIKSGYARPPLFNILGASFIFIFGNHGIILKVLSPIIGALIGIVFYLLVKRLYNKEIGLISSLILIGIPSFVTYAVLVLDEILFVFYMLIFILTFMLAIKEHSKKYWVLAAIFGGLSILTKNVGIVLFAFLPLAFIYILYKERRFSFYLRYFISIFIIILLVSGPFFLRNFAYYKTPLCAGIPVGLIDRSGCEKIEYEEKRSFEIRSLSGGTEQGLIRFGLLNYINFAYGNHWFILLGIIGGFIIFLTKVEKINFLALIMLILAIFPLYPTFNRAEDVARQTLFWASLLILISGFYWSELYKFLQKYQSYLGLVVIVIILFFSYQSITSKLPVMGNIKQFAPTFFEACDWVKENLEEDVILMTFWGHRAAYNCQRMVSPGLPDIRLNDNPEDIVNVAEMHGITHFFIQKFSITRQPSQESYSITFVQLLENNPEKFVKIYENGPSLGQCINEGVCDGNIIYEVNYTV